MLIREPLVYYNNIALVIVFPALDQTYLHSLFMCCTADVSYIQIAGLEMSYLQLIKNIDLQLYALLAY